MKCSKCGRNLGKAGEDSDAGPVGSDCKLPQGRENTYWCENLRCENFQKPGEIINEEFILLKEG